MMMEWLRLEGSAEDVAMARKPTTIGRARGTALPVERADASGSDERASAAIAATGSRVVKAWPGERAATDDVLSV